MAKNNLLKRINIFLLLYYVFFLSFILYSKGLDYWMDELFSYYMVKDFSLQEIFLTTKNDFHPPLYFFLLKIFTYIFGDNFLIFRFFSAVPFIIIFFIGAFPIKRLFGEKTSLIFLILVIIFPTNQYLMTEVRMYSWAMLTLTIMAVYLYDFYLNNTIKSFLITFIFSLASCYTHNYAFVGVGLTYGILIIYLLFKRNFNLLKKIFFLSFLIFVGYLPWLIILISQVKTVVNDYWIPDFSLSSLKISFLPFFAFTFFIFYPFFNGKPKTSKLKYSLFLFLISFTVCLFSISFSLLFHSIFQPRYFTPFFGIFLLSISISASEIKNKNILKIFYFFLIMTTITGYLKMYSNHKRFKRVELIREKLNNFITDENKNTVILYNNTYPDMHHFYTLYLDLTLEERVKNIYFASDKNISDISFNFSTINDINELLNSSDKIIYLNIKDDNYELFKKNKNILLQNGFNIKDSLILNEIETKAYYFYKKKME